MTPNVSKIIKYIITKGPVSHTVLEKQALSKGVSLHQFDTVMDKVAKHYQVSATVKGSDVWYKERIAKAKTESPVDRFAIWQKENPYPRVELGESPFKICFCALWRTEDDEIYNDEKHGHREDCDALLFPEEYKKQNIIRKMLI